MKLIAVNGSPRKEENTATFVEHAMRGAAVQGFETERIDLYDLNYRGCTSCYACKLKGGKSYGQCAMRDGLTPLLDAIRQTDALILGSPNYLGAPTGMMKAFLERLLYPYVVYDKQWSTLFPKKIPVVFIYTMGSSAEWMNKMGYDHAAGFLATMFRLHFGETETMIVNDTTMFRDYSKYVSSRFDPEEKARIRASRFPAECEKAYSLGAGLINRIHRLSRWPE